MKYLRVVLLILFFNVHACVFAQEDPGRTKFVIGLSGPELIHAGVTYRIANVSLVGLNAGIGPSWGEAWSAISLEHRLYFGKNSTRTGQKTWFCRQGTTFFPQADPPQQFTFNLTIGKDLIFKNNKRGITIDAGVFHLAESEDSSVSVSQSLNLWPALRFEFYFSL
jgi:hypothetical protein